VLRKDVQARAAHPQMQVELHSTAQLVGDQAEILSAFSNLVDNAVKYTPASGSIHLEWRTDAIGQGRFIVRDTGPGIAPEHLPRLTERFYRVDSGRSRAAGGAGLGLSIVKHIMQHHGGSLEVQSTEGVGSSFTCVFPARRVLAAETRDILHHSVKSASVG
jgi:two-component system phosphate regulon sensor histidine kinase PhoR